MNQQEHYEVMTGEVNPPEVEEEEPETFSAALLRLGRVFAALRETAEREP